MAPFYLTVGEWLSLASLSIGLSGLAAPLIFKKNEATAKAPTAALLFIILALSLSAFYSGQHARDAHKLAEKIYDFLGNQNKETTQILLGVGNPDLRLFSTAMAQLEDEGKIDSQTQDIDHNNQRVSIRVWRAKAQKDINAQGKI